MKKLVSLSVMAVLGASFLTSCLGDDASENQFTYIPLGVDSISMPDTAKLGVPVKIITYTHLKDECEAFYNFDYRATGENERTVIVWGMKSNGGTCAEKSVVIDPSFDFLPVNEGTYTIKFWNKVEGEGKDKESKYITQKIVIKR